MIAIGSRKLSETTSRFINVEGTNFVRNEWMVSQQGGPLSPSMHLAVQPPDYSLLAHYHRQNQFQLFVDGEGVGRGGFSVAVHPEVEVVREEGLEEFAVAGGGDADGRFGVDVVMVGGERAGGGDPVA